jgi:hypothetical protein
MRSRMFRISRSRLGAHTSRMGDISPNRFKLEVLLPEGRERRGPSPSPSWWRDLSTWHVHYLTRDPSDSRRR